MTQVLLGKVTENERRMIIEEVRQVSDADFYKDSGVAWDTFLNGLNKHCPKTAKFFQEHNIEPGRKEWLNLLEQTILQNPEAPEAPVVITKEN